MPEARRRADGPVGAHRRPAPQPVASSPAIADRRGCAADPAAARRRARPSHARGSACASANCRTESRARGRSRCWQRPRPRLARSAPAAPAHALLSATAQARRARPAQARSTRSPVCAVDPSCSSGDPGGRRRQGPAVCTLYRRARHYVEPYVRMSLLASLHLIQNPQPHTVYRKPPDDLAAEAPEASAELPTSGSAASYGHLESRHFGRAV